MKPAIKITLGIFSLLFVSTLVLIVTRNILLKFIIVSSTANYLGPIDFKIENFNLEHIKISHLKSSNLDFDQVAVFYNIKQLLHPSLMLRKIMLHGKLLSIDSPQNIPATHKKMTSGPNVSTKSLQDKLQHTKQIICQLLKQTELELSLKSVRINTQRHDLDLKVSSSVRSGQLDAKFNTFNPLPHKNKNATVQGQLSIACKKNILELKGQHLNLNAKNLKIRNYNLPYLKVRIPRAHLLLNHSDVFGELNGSIDSTTRFGTNTLQLMIDDIHLKGTLKILNDQILVSNLDVSALNVQGSNQKYQVQLKRLISQLFYDESLSQHKISGNFSDIKIMQVETQKNILMSLGLNIYGTLARTNNLQLQVNILPNSSSIKKIPLLVTSQLRQKSLSVRLKSQTYQIQSIKDLNWIPSLQKFVTAINGTLQLNGIYDLKSSKKSFIDISAKSFNFKAKDMELTEGSFHQHFTVSDNLTGNSDAWLKIKSFTLGKSVENIDIQHHFHSTNNLELKSAQWSFQGAQFQLSPTTLQLDKKSITPAKLTVTNLQVETLLKLFYRPQDVTATGSLSGSLPLITKNQIPLIQNGVLNSNHHKGLIRLRPPGSHVPDPTEIPTDVSQILKNYLYDFHYNDIETFISTNNNFDLQMTLRILGRNPGYLDGKPLKLSVNLELNILGMIQSAMASYDLPEGVKKRLKSQGLAK